MKVTLLCGGLILLSLVCLTQRDPIQASVQTASLAVEPQQQLVEVYCSGCHNDDTQQGGFYFAEIDIRHEK